MSDAIQEELLTVGQEVEWLTRPDGQGGYLHGTIVQIGTSRAKIIIQSPKTSVCKAKWAELRYLRKARVQDE